MPQFGTNSKKHYNTLHDDLQVICDEAIKHYDFSIIWGHRCMEAQNTAYNEGFSTKRWPTSRHNSYPAEAMDVIPYPDGFDSSEEEFYKLATYIYQAASELNIPIKWGGHWKKPKDMAHFQLVID